MEKIELMYIAGALVSVLLVIVAGRSSRAKEDLEGERWKRIKNLSKE